MSTSCTREAHFHKIAFSDFDICLEAKVMKKGSQNGTQMALKIIPKIRGLLDRFWTYFWRLLGTFWESKYHQKSSRKLSVFLESKNESWSRLWRSKGGPGVFGGPQACPGGALGRPGQTDLSTLLAPPNKLKPKNWWLWASGL